MKTGQLIIAHRGALGYAKENTIESFEKAMNLGADMIEFDVRRTKDHALVVYHDERIQGHFVKDLTFGAIRQITRTQGFQIPTVEEVLKWSGGKIRLDVELKEEGYEEETAELLTRYVKEDQFVITSFNDASLRAVKERFPDIKTGLILGKGIFPYHLLIRLQELFPMRRCKSAKADFLVAHWKLLRLGFLERAKRNRRPVFVWTVNDEMRMGRLLQDRRVYAIITDKPDLAVSLRKKLSSSESLGKDERAGYQATL
ncbi:MAG TPA: glycerophosphodiester phosphodiesterase [Thermodesulfobacteriota bacterium]|nr:glycerophosphodiester phosphodiesterase [Thermodesulfobacteriota bacterium]